MPAMVIQTTDSTATGAPVGGSDALLSPWRTVQAVVAGTGAVGATVEIYASNTPAVSGAGTNGLLLGTITLSGTTSASDGFAMNAPWLYVWSKVTAISGTGAVATVTLGA